MANEITAVKQFQKEIDVVIQQLKEVQKEVLSVSKISREIDFGKIKSPKGMDSGLKQVNTNTEQLNALLKEQASLEKKLISTIAKKTLAQEGTAKAVAKENEELKILRREQRNQVKQISALSTAYEKLQAETNQLIRQRQDLAVKQRQGVRLEAKETKQLSILTAAIQKNQKVLKDTDAEVGRFQRNVGNYSSGFDGLSNSINQLTREAPAFAVSAQTGILALSNNIPTLADEIGRLSIKNKELVESGKPAKSLFKSLTSAIFGWQTLLSLGVTLATLYGKEIGELVKKVVSGSKGFDALKESQKSLNEAQKEGVKSAVSEIAQMQILFRVSEDVSKSNETRNKAVNKLIKSSGGLIKEQDRLNILNGDALKLENKLTKAILGRATIQAISSKIAEDLVKVTENNVEIRKNEAEANALSTLAEQARIEAQEAGIFVENERLKISKDTTLTEAQKIDKFNELVKVYKDGTSNLRAFNGADQNAAELTNKNNKLKAENEKTQSKVNELIKEALKLTDDYTLELDDNTNSITKRNKAVALSIELAKEREKDLKIAKESLKVLNEIFKDDVSFELPEIDQDKLKEFQDKINEEFVTNLKINFAKEDLQSGLEDLAGTIDSVLGVSGDKFLDFFDKITAKGIDSFEDIGEIASSTFSLAGDVSNAFFQSKIDSYQEDIDANNEYYANLLENENLSDQERKRLELDKKQEEDKLRKKQQKEKQKQFEVNRAFRIAEIISDTALSIVKTGADLGYPAAIPFQVAAGVIGTTQLAIVASQSAPKFKEGHLSGTHEGIAIVNDANGSNFREVIERKDGTLEMYKGRDQAIFMNRGDKVHKAGTHSAESYFNGLPDSEILSNAKDHSILAAISHQNYLANRASDKRIEDGYRIHSDRIVKAISKQKMRFNVNNNLSLGDDLRYLNMSNEY